MIFSIGQQFTIFDFYNWTTIYNLWFLQFDNNLQPLIFTIGQQFIIFDFYNWTTISQIWFTIGQQFPIIDLQFDNNIQSLNFTIGQGFTILNQWFSIYNCGPSNTIVPCAGYHVVHRFWNLKLKQITDFFLYKCLQCARCFHHKVWRYWHMPLHLKYSSKVKDGKVDNCTFDQMWRKQCFDRYFLSWLSWRWDL